MLTTTLFAQEANVVSGGNASSSTGSVSYSVGQTFSNTSESNTGSVATGVQQAFEISVISAIVEANSVNLSCEAYPNPVTNYLQLNISELSFEDMEYQLYQANGTLVNSSSVNAKTTAIDMQQYTQGIYILNVISGNTKIKSFRIVKN